MTPAQFLAALRARGGVMDTVRPERLDASQRLAHAAIRGVLASIETASKPVPQPSSSVITSDPVVKLAG